MAIFGDLPDAQRLRAAAKLPGIHPVGQADWITVDRQYAAQLAERERLLATRLNDVYQMRPEAEDAAAELLQAVLGLLRERSAFSVSETAVICPDGRSVALYDRPPLVVLAHILQEDLCIHIEIDGVHHLMGAVLCFPASWTLAQKIGHPLVRLHEPVAEYDAALAVRVQRLFHGVQVGQPLWRANYLPYEDPTLYQPRQEGDRRPVGNDKSFYDRSERQTLIRLPKTRAVVFAIHTTVQEVSRSTLSRAP